MVGLTHSKRKGFIMTKEKVFWSYVLNLVKLRRFGRKNRARYCGIAALFAASIGSSGCHLQMGTPSGIREQALRESAMINEAKTSADIKSAHWGFRESTEKEVTARDTAPGFMSNLWGAK